MLALLVWLLAAPAAQAHVGSKDVFETVHAGPYTLYVTIRPPNVIPGIATVEVRSSGAAISGISITPLPLTGEASKHPPASDTMTASTADPAFFSGSVWLMATGTWQVQFKIEGASGPAMASVPVLAVPVQLLTMDRNLEIVLGLLGIFLVISMAGIVAASIREARLRPGVEATPADRRWGLAAMGLSLVVMGVVVALCSSWWTAEASGYARNIFAPSPTEAELNGNRLDLRVKGTPSDEWQRTGRRPRYRANDDYLPDHGRLMHLYAIREPQMDAAYHLHPQLVSPGDFRLELPAMPAGHYELFGDVVHSGGFPETLRASVDVPATMSGRALDPDDASAQPAPLSAGTLGPVYKLPDGYTMRWDRPAELRADTGYTFRFTLLNPAGRPATGIEPYLGMAGHAAFVKTDGSVFAHTHPDGSAAMADMELADQSVAFAQQRLGGNQAAAMDMLSAIGPEVSFPYGFPTAGRYRIFVQMKHGGTVETGVFDAEVK